MTRAKGVFPSEYIPTIYDNQTIICNQYTKSFELLVFDTVSMEDYDRLRPLSYPNTDVFVIVFSVDNRTSFEYVELKWAPG